MRSGPQTEQVASPSLARAVSPCPACERGPARPLADGEAHVWLTDVGERAPRRPEWLDPEEGSRWMRLMRAADRDLFLVAHCHLRVTLSRYADVPPGGWRFARGLGGRPEVAGEQTRGALRFNLSHAPGLVACVVSDGAACGVDVEREGRVADWAAIVPWLLHREERAAVAQRPQDILAYWTLKEAYVKAIGRGIRAPLRNVCFQLRGGPRADRPQLCFDGDHQTRTGWRFAHARPTAAHHLAVAVRPERDLRVRWA